MTLCISWNQKIIFAIMAIITLAGVSPVFSEWSTLAYENNAVSNRVGDDSDAAICSDGCDGHYIAWASFIAGKYQIYVQHIDFEGDPLWPENGYLIAPGSGDQRNPVIRDDGQGGCFVLWIDYRGLFSAVYGQRLQGANGAYLWASGGEPLARYGGDKSNLKISPDLENGIFIVYESVDPVTGNDIHAQRISQDAVSQWGGYVAVCDAEAEQIRPVTAYDPANGVYICWQDASATDLFAQRLDADGNERFKHNGEALVDADGYQLALDICPDGKGGMFAAWYDMRSLPRKIYAQHIPADGDVRWLDNGVFVSGSTDAGAAVPCVKTAASGDHDLFVVWNSVSESGGSDILAQKLDWNGDPQWSLDGVIAVGDPKDQTVEAVMDDGENGLFILYLDKPDETDLCAERLTLNGGKRWSWSPVVISNAVGNQFGAVLASGQSARPFWVAAWVDSRNPETGADVYAQALGSNGCLGDLPPPVPFNSLLLILAPLFSLMLFRLCRPTRRER